MTKAIVIHETGDPRRDALGGCRAGRARSG